MGGHESEEESVNSGELSTYETVSAQREVRSDGHADRDRRMDRHHEVDDDDDDGPQNRGMKREREATGSAPAAAAGEGEAEARGAAAARAQQVKIESGCGDDGDDDDGGDDDGGGSRSSGDEGMENGDGDAMGNEEVRGGAVNEEDVLDLTLEQAVERAVEKVQREGFVVVKMNGVDTDRAREDVMNDVRGFVEFLPEVEIEDRFPVGDFACFALPSSFHCRSVRGLRMQAYKTVSPMLERLTHLKGDDFKMEAIFDRLMMKKAVLPQGTKHGKRDWVREGSTGPEGDDSFGGWYNFSEGDTFFNCVAGTQNNPMQGQRSAQKVDLPEGAEPQFVRVPPGCILLFNSKLIHKQSPVPPETIRRSRSVWMQDCLVLYLSWRITTSYTSSDPNLENVLRNHHVPSLKSGQRPPNYPKTYEVYIKFRPRLTAWSNRFVDALKIENNRNEHVLIREMTSLTEYGVVHTLDQYEQDQIEGQIFQPHRNRLT